MVSLALRVHGSGHAVLAAMEAAVEVKRIAFAWSADST